MSGWIAAGVTGYLIGVRLGHRLGFRNGEAHADSVWARYLEYGAVPAPPMGVN